MKIIITEKQADILFGNEIKCSKCDHSWKKEKGDKHPYLCHSCGWDSESKKYNKEKIDYPKGSVTFLTGTTGSLLASWVV